MIIQLFKCTVYNFDDYFTSFFQILKYIVFFHHYLRENQRIKINLNVKLHQQTSSPQ